MNKSIATIIAMVIMVSSAWASPAPRAKPLHEAEITRNDCKYMVIEHNGTNIVKDCVTGERKYQSNNDKTAINWAFDNLTSGRTVNELVLAVGDFEIDGALVPSSSYTSFKLVGRIKLADSTNTDLMTVTSLNNIDISGGLWDGNYTNQSSGDGIELNAVSEFKIHDLKVQDVIRHGIFLFNGSFDGEVFNVFSDNAGDDSFTALTDVYNVDFTNIRGENGRSSTGSSFGLELEDGAYNINVTNAIFRDFPVGDLIYPGCLLITADSAQAAPYNVVVTNIFCDNAGRNGIQISSTVTDYIEGVKIIGGVVLNSGYDNISIQKSKHVEIIGLKLRNAAQNGINVTSSSKHVTISNNEISEASGHGIWLSDVTYCNVTNNKSFNNGQDNAWRAGIRVTNTDATDPGYHFISGNQFFDDQGSATQYDGISPNNTTENTFVDNVLFGNSNAPVNMGTVGALYFKNNIGYTLTAVALTADDTTPDVSRTNSAGRYVFTLPDHAGATAITDLDNPVVGETVTLIGLACPTNCATIADSGNFALNGAWTQATDASITLYIQGDNDYIEVSRIAP